MTEVKETMETTDKIVEVVGRKNPFCVISLYCNENGWYDIQDNSAWSAIPYDDYAEVPDGMYEGVKATRGYLIPTFSEDGKKLVDFTPTKIPLFPEPEREPTEEERLRADLDYLAIMTGVAL